MGFWRTPSVSFRLLPGLKFYWNRRLFMGHTNSLLTSVDADVHEEAPPSRVLGIGVIESRAVWRLAVVAVLWLKCDERSLKRPYPKWGRMDQQRVETENVWGDELLDEVCGDLQQRVQHIKAVLGEQPTVSDEIPLLTMQNKAPFWNEASQVYQVNTHLLNQILSIEGHSIRIAFKH